MCSCEDDRACGDGLPLGQPKTGCSFNKERGNLMNKDPFKEYIKQSEPNKRDMVIAFVLNDELYSYCKKLLEEGES